VQNYLNNKYKDCIEYEQYRWAVIIRDISFHDVNNDGKNEAIVIASSCYSGTGGPDIHAVYSKDSSGEIIDLFNSCEVDSFKGKPIWDNLVGNRNSRLFYEKNLLIEKFHDGSGRKNPLTLYYKWNGKGFILAKVEKAKVYKTSFNCARAKNDAEKTICGNAELAALDLKLDSLYKVIMSKLPENKRKMLKDEQREWIKERNVTGARDVDYFLQTAYKERVKFFMELKTFICDTSRKTRKK